MLRLPLLKKHTTEVKYYCCFTNNTHIKLLKAAATKMHLSWLEQSISGGSKKRKTIKMMESDEMRRNSGDIWLTDDKSSCSFFSIIPCRTDLKGHPPRFSNGVKTAVHL